ncbi:MAG: EscR/YscR/HrcR family type III secretion system export apparatus protein [Deltaproteobacteria bacterium]|jgi:type III secretion protein R|nr:EscR/YscR/HrcR family type III secretion system export apparatus protein [Deltaproteobacteria bacterium]
MNFDLNNFPIPLDSPLTSIGVFFVLACIPLFLLCFTSFIKLNVVFNILRNALGVGQIPSASIVFIMSFVLAIYIFAPVASEIKTTIMPVLQEKITTNKKTKNLNLDLEALLQIATQASQPLQTFLAENSRLKERVFFATLKDQRHKDKLTVQDVITCQAATHDCEIAGENLFSMLPAFLVSELRLAFIIGFMLSVPFLVVDLIVSNILLALNMTMLSPQVVSAPLKILLFVLSDAWYLLCKSLVLGN